jgi:predicted transposase/invertase (TIGR01784 family)
MLGKFLDPKNDVAFKRIFGNEKNQDILIHFLNDVLVFQKNRPICKITLLKTILDPDIASLKTSIVDILCEDDEGSRYIVEMQVANTSGFEKRAQYYAAKAYCSQTSVGGKYENLKEVIFLAIADYKMFPKKKDYKSDHVILDKKTQEQNLKDFSFTFIELPKFTKTIEELSTLEDKWCYFFKHAEETSPEDLKKLIGNDQIIERVYQELDRFYWNKEELQAYEGAEKAKNDYISSLSQKFNEGAAAERAKAEQEKVELQAKMEQEKAELQAKMEQEKAELQAKMEQEKLSALRSMAKSLREQGVPVLAIELATKLSAKEIEDL